MLFTQLLKEATAFAKAIGKRDRALVALLNEAKTALETVDEDIVQLVEADGAPDAYGVSATRARQLKTARNLGAALGKIDSVIQTLSNGFGPSDIEGSN
jgi:ABC-type transporter Mla subunit MlaD